MTMNAVEAAIAQAQANAGAIVTATNPAQTQVPAAAPARQASIADFANQSAVDVWMKVKEGGLTFGDDPKFHEQVTFLIDFADIDTFFSASGGNPPQYEKSRDRVMSESGKPWSAALADLSKYAGRPVRDFLSATLPLEVMEDIVGKSSRVEAGTIVGYTLAYTGSQEFAKLQKKMIKEGWSVTDGVYAITIGSIPAKNGNGNNYAKIQFLDIKPAE